MQGEEDRQNIPWIEKYRPTHFDDIVLDPMNRVLFQNILTMKHFPHLLFYGPPGTGKTTTIINLINEYQTNSESSDEGGRAFIISNKRKENVMHLNASDERGIDIIRIQINQFVKSKNLFETGLKFVILDEVDYMTKNAQQALKSLIQTCRNNVRFCLICNYISKIDESLKNEFICIRFNQLPQKEIHNFVQNIATKENIQLSDEDIDTILEIHKSDIRSIINFIQLNHHLIRSNKMTIATNRTWTQIHEIVKSGNKEQLLKFIHDTSIKYNIDKRSILIKYMTFIIRHLPDEASPAFFNRAEHICHSSDNTPVDCLIAFAITN